MKCFLLIITSIVFIISCGSDDIPEPGETKPNYFPDTIGSQWIYRNADGNEWTREITNRNNTQDNTYHTFINNPSITKTDNDLLEPTSFRVTQTQLLLDISNKINRYIQTELPKSVQDDFTGLEIDVITESISYPELVYLHFPLSTNLHWDVLDVEIQGNIILQNLTLLHIPFETIIKIAAKVKGQSLIETPAGSFEDTYQIEYQMDTTHKIFSDEDSSIQINSIWFTPHVGIVKIEDNNGISELVEYTLK